MLAFILSICLSSFHHLGRQKADAQYAPGEGAQRPCEQGMRALLFPRDNLHPLQQHPRDLAVDVLAHGRAVRRGFGRHREPCCA